MPSPDELRDLIQQVEAKGGPLRLGDHYPWIYDADDPIASLREACETPTDQDMLTGILRRDVLENGAIFSHVGRIVDGEVWHVVWIFLEEETEPPEEMVCYRDPLTAWLRAWLTGHERGLVGRQEGNDDRG